MASVSERPSSTAAEGTKRATNLGMPTFPGHLMRVAWRLLRCYLNGPVVVTVIAVRVMEVAIDQVVNVVAVGHRFVPAASTMDMARLVSAAIVLRSAVSRVGDVDRQNVLINVPNMRMMQMPIMEVIGVAIVFDGRMATARAVNVIVVSMLMAWGWSDLVSHTRISGWRVDRLMRCPQMGYSANTSPGDAPAEPRVGCRTEYNRVYQAANCCNYSS